MGAPRLCRTAIHVRLPWRIAPQNSGSIDPRLQPRLSGRWKCRPAGFSKCHAIRQPPCSDRRAIPGGSLHSGLGAGRAERQQGRHRRSTSIRRGPLRYPDGLGRRASAPPRWPADDRGRRFGHRGAAFRSQERNREDARERLVTLIRRALEPPRPRRPTKPSRAARVARLEAKRQRARAKQRRPPPDLDGAQ